MRTEEVKWIWAEAMAPVDCDHILLGPSQDRPPRLTVECVAPFPFRQARSGCALLRTHADNIHYILASIDPRAEVFAHRDHLQLPRAPPALSARERPLVPDQLNHLLVSAKPRDRPDLLC